MKSTFNTVDDIGGSHNSTGPGGPVPSSMARTTCDFLIPVDTPQQAEKRGREEYYAWFKIKGSTCIDGTEPDNPYPEGTVQHDAWDDGRWSEKKCLVLVEMGR